MTEETKKISLGIPRALIYYKYSKFWPIFFEGLGFEVIISLKTNKEILAKGCAVSETESCLSYKIYQGHIDYLINKVNPDYIFVPRIISLRKDHLSCPKFFGLPDIVKIQGAKQNIIEPEINFDKEDFKKTIFKIGSQLNKEKNDIKKAYMKGYLAETKLWQEKVKSYYDILKSPKRKIVLISHPYNLYDEFINLNIKKKLEKNKVEVIFIDSVPYHFKEVFAHWDFAAEMINQVDVIRNQSIDGAIQLTAFNCGCDSIINEFIADKFKEKSIPYLSLIIDEHAAEAGLETRIEAFLDTLR